MTSCARTAIFGWLVHHPERIYNADAFHAAQIALVPASASLFYPPVSGNCVIMAPLSRLPFGMAATVWSLIMVGLYALIIGGHIVPGSPC